MISRLLPAAPLLLLGCVHADPIPKYTPAWEPIDASQAGWKETRKFLVISDCQIHNLLSLPVPDRNLTLEAAAATAIRPPQLDLFSPDVLRWILQHGAPDADAVIHLGDALDLACEGEFDTFLEVMRSGGKPWFMAPGNHDFFYLGSYSPRDETWTDACHGSVNKLTKDMFIRMYVAALIGQEDSGCKRLATSLGLESERHLDPKSLAPRIPLTHQWRDESASADGFLSAIAWNIDEAAPWRSFIVQLVDDKGLEGSRVRVLLLDSCQYQRRPELIPNAWASYPFGLNCGLTGEMLPDQLRVVRSWIESDPATRVGAGFTLACHHPFDDLAARTQSNVGWLWRERNVGIFLTGHTHEGYYKSHDLGGDEDFLELNLASTTDWPMEWRTLSGVFNGEQERFYIRAERHTLVDTLKNEEGFFLLDWEVPVRAPDDYRRYKQGKSSNDILVDFYLAYHLIPYWLPQPVIPAPAPAWETEESVKDTLLWTYFRLLQFFPTDVSRGLPVWPHRISRDQDIVDRIISLTGKEDTIEEKIDFLGELAHFEKSRLTKDPHSGNPNDEMRARFKLSQAAWASRFERSSGRKLSVEDDLIRIDADSLQKRKRRLQN